jgi:hypothetical protein
MIAGQIGGHGGLTATTFGIEQHDGTHEILPRYLT